MFLALTNKGVGLVVGLSLANESGLLESVVCLHALKAKYYKIYLTEVNLSLCQYSNVYVYCQSPVVDGLLLQG